MVIEIVITSPIIGGSLVSTLMISDMYLTKLGYNIRNEGYSYFFKHSQYELNPRYRDIIESEQSLPIREILFRIIFGLIIGIAIYLVQVFNDSPDPVLNDFLQLIIEIVLGAILILYFDINLLHIRNISLFSFIRNNKDLLNGQIIFSKEYIFMSSRVEHTTFTIIWAIVYFLTDMVFFMGGTLQQLLMIYNLSRWENSANNEISPEN